MPTSKASTTEVNSPKNENTVDIYLVPDFEKIVRKKFGADGDIIFGKDEDEATANGKPIGDQIRAFL